MPAPLPGGRSRDRMLALIAATAIAAACGPLRPSAAALGRCPDTTVSDTSVQVRVERVAMHDIAFRIGCDGEYWLAVLDQGRRSGRDRQVGGVGAVELTPEFGPAAQTYVGVVEDLPGPEVIHGWVLTAAQRALLEQRGGFIRLTALATDPARRSAGTAGEPAGTVRVEEVIEDVDRFVGRSLTLQGEVARVLSPRVFSVGGESVPFNQEIMVVAREPVTELRPKGEEHLHGPRVRVAGTLRRLAPQDVERQLGPEIAGIIRGARRQQLLLLADAVRLIPARGPS